MQIVVDALYVYPIKSCAPVRVESLAFNEERRLVGDREWAVVDESASVVWQGSHPRLALIHPEFQKEHLALRSSEGHYVQIQQGAMRALRDVNIWNDTAKRNEVFAATDAGDKVAAFLENTVGARLRLVRLGPEAHRREGSDRVHIVSTTSFHEIAADLSPAARHPQNLMRFRPNIVVAGLSEPLMPFLEEQFTALGWTDGRTAAALEARELCIRCVVPNVDPETAREEERVLEVLGKHSAARYPGEPIYFGIYASVNRSCTLHGGAVLEASLAI